MKKSPSLKKLLGESAESRTCVNCRHVYEPAKLPESSMGSVKCPSCGMSQPGQPDTVNEEERPADEEKREVQIGKEIEVKANELYAMFDEANDDFDLNTRDHAIKKIKALAQELVELHTDKGDGMHQIAGRDGKKIKVFIPGTEKK